MGTKCNSLFICDEHMIFQYVAFSQPHQNLTLTFYKFLRMNFSFKSQNPDENQISLHNGEEIFEAIKKALKEAASSIKIAAAWFTDYELFKILMQKRTDSPACAIEIVLDDNKENYWLPFIDLVKMGAVVKLSQGIGNSGRMHEKFCIIDNSMLINGSYNWSKNARTENHENVIISRIPSTVGDFCEKFNTLLTAGKFYQSENLIQEDVSKEDAIKTINEQEAHTKAFEKVLDEMIYASVTGYNKEELVRKGFDRSEKCSGDATIINNELNTVYTELLNSVSASEQKKELLKAKVYTHLEQNKSMLSENCDREKEQLQIEEDNLIKSFKNQINTITEVNKEIKEEITKIESSDIRNHRIKIEDLSEKKKLIEQESLSKPTRWLVQVPVYLGLFLVTVYVFLFYSSAVYILMFSEQEAKKNTLLKIPVEEISIYYSKAIPKAFEEGWFALLIILLAPAFLICGIVFIKKIKAKEWVKHAVKVFCLVVIDGFTALAVTKAIHENNYLAGLEKEHFQAGNVFKDTNFYLVFIFGMLSLLVFDLIISYVMKNLQSRDETYQKAQQILMINNLSSEIAGLQSTINELETQVTNKRAQIEHNLIRIAEHEKDIDVLPTQTKRKINYLQNETNNQINNLENIVKIAYQKIENELFSFSTHFMKDRINVFLQGWNNFIYSYYSKNLSEQKVKTAKEFSAIWLDEHLKNGIQKNNS